MGELSASFFKNETLVFVILQKQKNQAKACLYIFCGCDIMLSQSCNMMFAIYH